MAQQHRTLFIFPASSWQSGLLLLSGCGGSGSSTQLDSDAQAAAPTFSPAGWKLHDGADRHHLRLDRRRHDLLHDQRNAPTTASTVYSGAITIPATPATETIEAIAVASGYTNSPVATAVYKMSLSAATAAVVGADVGWLTQLESMGYTWTDTTGASGSALQILKNAGVNTIRIRTFVNPTITAGVLGVGAWIRRAASRWPNRPVRWASRS